MPISEEIQIELQRLFDPFAMGASPDAPLCEKALDGLLRLHLGRDAHTRGWWGLLQLTLRTNRVQFGHDSLKDTAVLCGGEPERILSPAQCIPLLPQGTQVTVQADEGQLLIGVDPPATLNPITVDPSLVNLNLPLYVRVDRHATLTVDRLRTRNWVQILPDHTSGAAASPVASPTSEFTDRAIVLEPLLAFNRRRVLLPMQMFHGLTRTDIGGRKLFWFAVSWPEDAAAAAKQLQGNLIANTAIYCDRIYSDLDPQLQKWDGRDLLIQRTGELPNHLRQGMLVLDVHEQVTGKTYHDLRHVPDRPDDGFLPIRESEIGPNLARLCFQTKPALPLMVRLCYFTLDESSAKLKATQRFDARNDDGVAFGTMLDVPSEAWNDISADELWNAFCMMFTSRRRCVSRHDVRMMIRSFDLLDLNHHLIKGPDAIMFEQKVGRWLGAVLPYSQVTIHLKPEHTLSPIDLDVLRVHLEKSINATAVVNSRLRVRLVTQQDGSHG